MLGACVAVVVGDVFLWLFVAWGVVLVRRRGGSCPQRARLLSGGGTAVAECLSRGGLWVEVFCFVAADDVDEAVYIFSAGQHALVGVVGVNQQAAAAHVGVEGVVAVHLVGLPGCCPKQAR